MNAFKYMINNITKTFYLLLAILIVGCSTNVKDLEMRVAKLETEVASLKQGGVSAVSVGSFPKFKFSL